jgi:transforming growth factor-beta-induced protein
MQENNSSKNNSTLVYGIGALAVAAVVGGVFLFNSNSNSSTSKNSSSSVSSSAVSSVDAMKKEPKTVVDIALSDSKFTTLVTALKAAGLVETLQGSGPFTVFAPTNEAFAKLPAGTVENLLKPENKAKLTEILTYHVVSGKVVSTQLTDKQVVPTLFAKNNVTVDLSSGVKINGAKVIAADNLAENGVVHVIDSVLLPATPTIVSTAVANPEFSTLVTALKAAGLVETLNGAGPFTVFAPTNAAFAKLPAGTVENLLKPENKADLVKILTYHVVPAKVLAKDLVDGQAAPTVQGQTIKVGVHSGVTLNDKTTVTSTDIDAGNGVIHVIDSVLLPQ